MKLNSENNNVKENERMENYVQAKTAVKHSTLENTEIAGFTNAFVQEFVMKLNIIDLLVIC